MKPFLLITFLLLFYGKEIFCQCASPGLNIQSAACTAPKNLNVKSVTCSEVIVSWTGNKDQTYLVKASSIGPATNVPVELKPSKVSCDNSNSCTATIKVNEGSNVIWSVQSICHVEQASLYSTEIKGKDAAIPVCEKLKDTDNIKKIHVYPNPAPGYLMVEFSGKVEGGSIEFQICDITGKKILTKTESAITGTINRYSLDLHTLPPGTYMLVTYSGKSVNQSKFVLTKKE